MTEQEPRLWHNIHLDTVKVEESIDGKTYSYYLCENNYVFTDNTELTYFCGYSAHYVSEQVIHYLDKPLALSLFKLDFSSQEFKNTSSSCIYIRDTPVSEGLKTQRLVAWPECNIIDKMLSVTIVHQEKSDQRLNQLYPHLLRPTTPSRSLMRTKKKLLDLVVPLKVTDKSANPLEDFAGFEIHFSGYVTNQLWGIDESWDSTPGIITCILVRQNPKVGQRLQQQNNG